MTDRPYGFKTRALHAGNRPDPSTGARAVPDLPDHQLRVRGHRRRRRPVRPAEVRQHLQPHRQPDGGRVRGAHGSASRAGSAPWPRLERSGRRVPHLRPPWPAPATTSSPSASLYGGTRHPARRHAAAARRRHHVRARRRPGRRSPRRSTEHQADLHRGDRRTRPARSPTWRRSPTWPTRRPAARRRRHVGHARTSAGRSSTAPTSSCTRPRSSSAGTAPRIGGVVVESGRFHWDNGRFPQMTEPVPSYGGLRWWGNFGEYALLTRLRAEQLRDIGAAMSPVQRLPVPAGPGDAAAADGRPRGQRPLGRRVARRAHPQVAWVRYAGLPVVARTTSSRSATCRRARARSSPSASRGGRAAGAALHRDAGAGQPPGQRRRRQDARDPPGLDHPPAAIGRGAAGRRRPARPGPPVGRHRGRRRHLLGPRPGAGRGGQGGLGDLARVDRSTPRPAPASACEILRPRPARSPSSGASPNPARASYFVATYLLSYLVRLRVWFVNPTRDRDPRPCRCTRRWPRCPWSPTWSTCSGGRRTCPRVAEDAVAVGARDVLDPARAASDDAAAVAPDGRPRRRARTAASRSSTPASTAACTSPGFDTGVIDCRRWRP